MCTEHTAGDRDTTLMTAKEVSAKLGISESFLWRRIKRKKFPPPLHIGRSAKWPTYVVDEWIMEAAK